ncbi:MAG: hypothetical protein ACI85I_002429, partial [Arenicella sp.]
LRCEHMASNRALKGLLALGRINYCRIIHVLKPKFQVEFQKITLLC